MVRRALEQCYQQITGRRVMPRQALTLNVNHHYQLDIEPHRTLLSVLREELGLTGTKQNCLEAEWASALCWLTARP
jgi:carbon-monoxide dehydrogenase small subunit